MDKLFKQAAGLKWGPLAALIAILVGTAVFYAPAIHFGIFWDDPVWYGHALGKTWWQTLLPSSDFQFYRPLSTLYTWVFLRADGTFAFEWQHAFQIMFHLLNTLLAFALSRRLGLGYWAAVAVSVLLASYPFAFQAVAWAAPQQPIVAFWQTVAWLAYLIARPPVESEFEDKWVSNKQKRRLWLSLLFYLLALLVQESSVAVAFVPLLYEIIFRQKIGGWANLWRMPQKAGWALAFVALAGMYGLIWLVVPRQAGITQIALEWETAVYLLQGLVYPLLGRPSGYQSPLPMSWFWLITAVTVVILIALAVRHGRGRLAFWALSWAILSQIPAFVGLELNYVELGSRLLYAAALPVILLWVSALWPPSRRNRRLSWIGPLLVLLIAGQSVWLMTGMVQDYERGTDHLQEAITTMTQSSPTLGGNGRFLFINFPDRYKDKQPPYPYGYWGLTLAPVIVDLADFVPLLGGQTAVSESYSMPWVDTTEREASPYAIDMRGVIIQPQELAQLASDGAAIYVSRYDVDGRFQLQQAGWLGQAANQTGCLAQFEGTICLHSVDYASSANEIEIKLIWSSARPLLPNQTIFVHLGEPGQPPLSQADGDAWRGLLPLSDWPQERMITEYRTLPRLTGSGSLTLQIGIYNRETGQRLMTETAVDYFGIPLE